MLLKYILVLVIVNYNYTREEADSGGRGTEGASNISDEVGLTSPCCWVWQLFTKGERFATCNNAHQ